MPGHAVGCARVIRRVIVSTVVSQKRISEIADAIRFLVTFEVTNVVAVFNFLGMVHVVVGALLTMFKGTLT